MLPLHDGEVPAGGDYLGVVGVPGHVPNAGPVPAQYLGHRDVLYIQKVVTHFI